MYSALVQVGAQALSAVAGHDSAHKLPVAAGIVIIAMITMFVALFGYRYVHLFERYASVPVAIILIIMLGEAAPRRFCDVFDRVQFMSGA